MQQFQVPQFIEVEDKIFGPLTTKQFFYLLGGGGLTFLIWFFVENYFITGLLAAPIIALAAALAFIKVNGRPFIDLLSNAVLYITKPRLYLWQKSKKPAPQARISDTKVRTGLIVPKVTQSKLSDLTWSLEIMQNVSRKKEEEDSPQRAQTREQDILGKFQNITIK
ncbi:MAG: hypothetical protein G01um101470_76 [Parcubacteria group bacterium Gr01-1014_70]|nr:MAG: hypothetical protein G01um101470_76 [Parcubacteria group bacterium Gr01-1014_70]